MIKFLQVNLHRTGTALDLCFQTARERASDVLVLSEQPRCPPDNLRWISSVDNTCAVALTSSADFEALASGRGVGYSWMRFEKTVVFSCYCSPNCHLLVFEAFLNGLETELRRLEAPGLSYVVGGDFIFKFPEWGSHTEDQRGELLSSLAASLRLLVANEGKTPTFHGNVSSSIIDVTFARCARCMSVNGWRVLGEIFSGSDHDYICFQITTERRSDSYEQRGTESTLRGWAIRKLDKGLLIAHLRQTRDESSRRIEGMVAEDAVQALTESL